MKKENKEKLKKVLRILDYTSTVLRFLNELIKLLKHFI